MGKNLVLKISEARAKLTQLDKLIKPGESIQITKKGKPYAYIKLIQDEDTYETVLDLIESLPKPEERMKNIAQNYKKVLYNRRKEGSK